MLRCLALVRDQIRVRDININLKFEIMKTSIAIINSSITLKQGNCYNGYNFYEWLKDAKKVWRPDLPLIQLWIQICYAVNTEESCKSHFSLKK